MKNHIIGIDGYFLCCSKKYYDLENPRDAEEILNYLQEISDDDDNFNTVQQCDHLDLVLLPPEDVDDSDKDDAPSDEEGEYEVKDIGKGILKQPMEIFAVSENNEDRVELNLGSRDDEFDESDDEIPLSSFVKRKRKETANKQKASKSNQPKEIPLKRKPRNWQEKTLTATSEKSKLRKNPQPAIVERIQDENLAPVDLFKMFFSEEYVQNICDETNKYAIFKGNHNFSVSTKEMYIYLGILILSGYCKLPARRMYWETKSDTFNSLVSNSISRDRFETIHRFLHFNDNTKIDASNKLYKIQPLLDRINEVSQALALPLGENFSLDEAMEPYYGHHHMKQFIKGKPIRYGFKFWCLSTSEGYLLKFDPYCGAGDKKEGKSLGSSVTEKLCLEYLPENSTIFIDNFFNSLPLLNDLKNENIKCIGTIRADRVEKAPLKDLKKEVRGSIHAIQDINESICLVRWHDNSQVTIGTNIDNDQICLTKGKCKRWSKKEKAYVYVDQPTLVNLYNQGMGGVDLFDKLRGLYRIRIRSKKWYWPFIRFCLNGSLVNMWIIYRYAFPKMSLLAFTRRVVLSLLTAPEHLSGPKPKCSRSIPKEIRYDRIDHLIASIPTQRQCAYCKKCAKFICSKCNVGVHPKVCFQAYHTSL